jgi:hypothetical protein
MPLLDHFHPPLYPRRQWGSFHITWASTIADILTDELLPEGYFAAEHAHAESRIEIDVATFEEASAEGTTATQTYAPPVPSLSVPAVFPEEYELRVYGGDEGVRLVAAIELISPANKDREDHRSAFANKCAGYLAQGVSLIIVDVVTNRSANLHAEIMQRLGRTADQGLSADANLYAVAYRPVVRDGSQQIDVWTVPLAIGHDLPTLPMALSGEIVLPIDLEASYTTACQRRRLG